MSLKSDSKANKQPEGDAVASSADELATGWASPVAVRIREVRGTVGQPEFAAELGMTAVTYGRYERGERPPNVEFLDALIRKRDVSADWLLTGSLPKEFSARSDSHQAWIGEQVRARYSTEGAFVMLPLYDIRATAGYGALVEDRPPDDFRAFARQWLEQEIRVQPFDRLALVTISGSSMEPDLHDGDAVMLDRGDKDVLREGVYVFFLDGHVFVKKLLLRGDKLLIISSNGDHATQELKLLQEHVSFRIIGRVIGQPLFRRF